MRGAFSSSIQKLVTFAVPATVLSVVLWKGGKTLDATWLVGGLSVLMIYWSYWKRRKNKIVPSRVSVFLWVSLILFLAWSVLSFVYSETQNYGLDEIFRDAACGLLLLWAARFGTTEDLRRFTSALVLATILACVFGVFVYALQPVSRFVGTFLDWRFHTDYWPNAWAQFLLLTWPLVLLWMRRRWSFFGTALTGFVIGCLLLSYSRGAFLAFCAEVLLLALAALWMLVQRKVSLVQFRRLALECLLIPVVAIATFFAVNAIRARTYEVESAVRRAQFETAEKKTSIDERRDFWEQAIQLTTEKPLFGWGPYSFRFAHQPLERGVIATSDHPHNAFLKLSMERGIPAALLFALVIIFSLLGPIKRLIIAGKHHARADASWEITAMAGVFAVLAHNMIDFNLQFLGIFLPFMLVLGFLVKGETSVSPPRMHRILEILVAVFLGVFLLLEGRMLLLSALGRHAEAADKPKEAIMWYDSARTEIFSRDLHLSRSVLRLTEGDFAAAEQALADYRGVNALDPRVWILQGEVSLAQDNTPAALDAIRIGWERGKMNYLQPLERLLQLQKRGIRIDWLTEEDATSMFRLYCEAVIRNDHFIALSDTVELLGRILPMLTERYPAKAQELRALYDRAKANADMERMQTSARAPGMLW